MKKIMLILALTTSAIVGGCSDDGKICSANNETMALPHEFTAEANGIVFNGAFYKSVEGGGSGTILIDPITNINYIMQIQANNADENHFQIEIVYEITTMVVHRVELVVASPWYDARTSFSCVEEACFGITADVASRTFTFDEVALLEEGGTAEEKITGTFSEVEYENDDYYDDDLTYYTGALPDNCYQGL